MNTVCLPHQVNDSLSWHLDAYPQSVLEKWISYKERTEAAHGLITGAESLPHPQKTNQGCGHELSHVALNQCILIQSLRIYTIKDYTGITGK